MAICFWIPLMGETKSRYKGELGSTPNVIMQVDCCASNPPTSHHLFAINESCHSDHRCQRIEGTMRSSIKSIKVPSITPLRTNIDTKQGVAICLESRHREPLLRGDLLLISSSRDSFARRSAFFFVDDQTADCHAPHALVSWLPCQNRGS